MVIKDGSRAAYIQFRWIRVVGFLMYAFAFLLPSVRESVPPGALVPPSQIYKGWFCAFVTLMNTFGQGVWESKDCLAVLSGWINPLILIYLVLQLGHHLVWQRRLVAALIVAFMFLTWTYFVLAPLVPLVGHYLWIVGALMILSGELPGSRPAATAAKSNAASGL